VSIVLHIKLIVYLDFGCP